MRDLKLSFMSGNVCRTLIGIFGLGITFVRKKTSLIAMKTFFTTSVCFIIVMVDVDVLCGMITSNPKPYIQDHEPSACCQCMVNGDKHMSLSLNSLPIST